MVSQVALEVTDLTTEIALSASAAATAPATARLGGDTRLAAVASSDSLGSGAPSAVTVVRGAGAASTAALAELTALVARAAHAVANTNASAALSARLGECPPWPVGALPPALTGDIAAVCATPRLSTARDGAAVVGVGDGAAGGRLRRDGEDDATSGGIYEYSRWSRLPSFMTSSSKGFAETSAA